MDQGGRQIEGGGLEEEGKSKNILCSIRCELALVFFFGYFVIIALELNLSIALPAMTISKISQSENRMFSDSIYNESKRRFESSIPKECRFANNSENIENKVREYVK